MHSLKRKRRGVITFNREREKIGASDKTDHTKKRLGKKKENYLPEERRDFLKHSQKPHLSKFKRIAQKIYKKKQQVTRNHAYASKDPPDYFGGANVGPQAQKT